MWSTQNCKIYLKIGQLINNESLGWQTLLIYDTGKLDVNLGKPAAYDQNFQLTERRVMKSYSGWGGRDKGPALRGLSEILETTFLIIDKIFFFFFGRRNYSSTSKVIFLTYSAPILKEMQSLQPHSQIVLSYILSSESLNLGHHGSSRNSFQDLVRKK